MSESGLFLLLPDSPEQEQGVSSRDVLNIPITKQISSGKIAVKRMICRRNFLVVRFLLCTFALVTCDF